MRPIQLALGLLCLCLALSVRAAASAPELPADELAAIVQEAGERTRLGENSSDPVGPPWRTLTREKLERLLHSPQFAQVGYSAHGELLDQAFAWDLVHFASAGDVKRFFLAVNGPDYFPPPPETGTVNTGYIGFYADATASAEGAAVSALFNCLPRETWTVVSADPLLWSMQHGEWVDVPNANDFGKCVRQQREDMSTPEENDPVSARGRQSAAIIADRLSRQLLARGCAGTGPDSCLVGLRALMLLDPQRPDLVAIVRKLHAQVDATRPVAIAKVADGSVADTGPQHVRYEQTRFTLWRRGLVLAAELDLMHARPRDWTPREVDAATDAAIAQMLAWRRLDWSVNVAGRHNAREYDFAMPWLHLAVAGVLPDATATRIRQLGGAAAAAPGCGMARLAREDQPAEFWYAYASAKLHREGQDCHALPLDWIAEHYVLASRAGAPPPFADILQWVGDAGNEVHERVHAAIANRCPASDWGTDPWGVCTRQAAAVVAERERELAQQRAEEAKAREEEAKARALAQDPCRDELLQALQQRLGYVDAEGNPVAPVHVGCKRLPDAPATAAVAIFHLAHQDGGDEDGDYDLHLLLVDRDGRVQAQGKVAKAAYSDAVRLEGVDIDTGRYRLAPGVRAFGVTTSNSTHCYQCAYSESALRLFVREGKVLRQVLEGISPAGTNNDEDGAAPGCTGATVETTRTIAVAPTRHAGFADLVVTTQAVSQQGFNEDGEDCPGASAATPTVETWIYDGRQYRAPAAAK